MQGAEAPIWRRGAGPSQSPAVVQGSPDTLASPVCHSVVLGHMPSTSLVSWIQSEIHPSRTASACEFDVFDSANGGPAPALCI